MNEYFTGFEFGKSDHLPIDFVELPLCQSTMPAKQRGGNFRNFLLTVMRYSIFFTFQSVVSFHTRACCLFEISYWSLSLHKNRTQHAFDVLN